MIKQRRFIYKCLESLESQHAYLWQRTGQIVTVLSQLGPDVVDPEVGPMFRVRFPCGLEDDVFGDELQAE